MRQRLRQRGAARGEQAQRQTRRDIAALGNLPSGAALKQRQIAAQQAEELTGREVQDVNILLLSKLDYKNAVKTSRDLGYKNNLEFP
jgi:hypothetical protein